MSERSPAAEWDAPAWAWARFEAGLRVEALREPRPSEADVAADPDLGKSRARPSFLHVRCRR